jgi:(p)ppGpp synthase/HD superfamily hydrolase
MVVNFAKCCHPIPDDPIVGFLSTGRGLVIHTQSCKNVSGHVVSRTHLEKWIDVAWEPNVESELPVEIRIQAENHKGVLATLAATISDMGSNIDNVVIADQDGPYTSLLFTIDVMNRGHLAQIIQRLRTIPVVSDIHRTGS